MEQSNEITLIGNHNPAEIYKSGGIRSIIDKVRAEVLSIVTDVTTEKGREEIRSLAYKVARTKTKLDEIGKELTEEWRQSTNRVNAERRLAREELDKIKEEVRKPLTEYENREAQRIAKHKANVEKIMHFRDAQGVSSDDVMAGINQLKAIVVDSSYEEFEQIARLQYKESMDYLQGRYNALKKAEDERAELEKLRKEQAERERKEREERIAKEAAEKAKREAEEKAQREAEAQREKFESEKRAEKERFEKLQRERQEDIKQAKRDAEAAAMEREKAEERHKREIEEQARKAAEAAESRKRERLAKEAEERRIAESKAADKKHRARVINEAVEDLEVLLKAKEGAREIASAIAEGYIRNVSIKF